MGKQLENAPSWRAYFTPHKQLNTQFEVFLKLLKPEIIFYKAASMSF